MTKDRALWLMVGCLLLAALLRLPALDDTPPGLHYDEAANASLAADIGLRGERPIFITSYTGKEVLFFYAAGALMRLVGESVFTLRLASAFLALLTVAATYWLGRALLADRRVAVIAAALLAISFWHLLFSRYGFRAISQPLLQALSVAALFHGLKQEQGWRWFVLSGLFLGLTAYTYLAARLFPVPLGLALLPLLFDSKVARRRWRQVGLTVLVAVVVAAPLLLFFYQNPEAFWVRIQQVAPDDSASGATTVLADSGLLNSYVRSLGMFFLVGDPYWRFNLPGRPLFNWFWGGLLLVGWLVALWRWRRWWYDWQKAAVLLLLLAPLTMVLPTALAVGEIVPSNLRAIGLIPFIFFLPALGLVTLLEQIADLFRRPDESVSAFLRYLNVLEGYDLNYAFVVLLILLLGGAFSAQSYFEEWATRSDLYYESDADLAAVAQYLDEQADPDAALYLAAPHYRHPTVAFLSERYEEIRWLPNAQALPLPPEGPALYVFPHNSPAPSWAQPFLEGAERTVGPQGPDDAPVFTAYRLEQPALPSGAPSQEVAANFGNVITLLGYDARAEEGSDALPVTLYWRVEGSAPAPVRPFVHLEDRWGSRWGQSDPTSYPAEQWQVGEVIVQHMRIPLRAGAPPGQYRLRVGLFDEQSGERLLLLEEGQMVGSAVTIEPLSLAGGPTPAAPPEAPRGAPQTVRPGLQLLGYERGDEPVPTGARLPLALWWWASEPQPSMTVRLELLRGDNTGKIILDTTPVHGTFPFERWGSSAAEMPLFVHDEVNPQFPADLEGGEYRLHLRLLDAESSTVFTSSLGTVTVTPTERQFQRPQTEYPLAATFAGEIQLVGYNLEQLEGRRYGLQLVWQALQAPTDDYTVFVHLLREDGSCCLWQQDVMPRQGTYPSSRWVAGEYVLDEYEIEIPPEAAAGERQLEVGLYVAETGQRLQVSSPGAAETDVVYLRPLVLEE
ncbi:MAG: ArnT family glycosyltransferase [Chloroflexota bacterium]